MDNDITVKVVRQEVPIEKVVIELSEVRFKVLIEYLKELKLNLTKYYCSNHGLILTQFIDNLEGALK